MDESLIIGFDFELISFTQLDSFITCKWCNASFHIVMAIQRVGPNFAFHFGDLSPVVSICSRHSFMRYTDMRLLRSNYINNCICYCLCSSYQIINICILTIWNYVCSVDHLYIHHIICLRQHHITCHLHRGPNRAKTFCRNNDSFNQIRKRLIRR